MRIQKILINPIQIVFIVIVCIAFGSILMLSDLEITLNAFAEEQEMEDEEDNLDIIMIDNDDYDKDRKGPVKFPHLQHARDYGLICWDCHHEYEDGKNLYSPWGTTLACADCHDPSEKMDEMVKLQTAYHLSCKTCHEKMKIYGDEPFVYRKCTKCHEPAK